MTAPLNDKHSCRWHEPGGRCADPQAFPGAQDVPPFCVRHLAALEPWISARARMHGGSADSWITWARRQAEDVQLARQALGYRRGSR
jgi:hypothetical protein